MESKAESTYFEHRPDGVSHPFLLWFTCGQGLQWLWLTDAQMAQICKKYQESKNG